MPALPHPITPALSHLARLRRDRGWSQQQLADRAEVSRTEISAIETGRLVPSVSAALRIAAALGQSVETAFASVDATPPVAWAWAPAAGDGRVWRARVGRGVVAYQVEPTAAGVMPHDAWFDGACLHARGEFAADRTLVMAGCDPLVGLLAQPLTHEHGVRVLPLLRSSAQALDLLRLGLVHVAGLHVTDVRGRSTNAAVVRRVLGRGYRLLHQVRWEAGIAVVGSRRERTPTALLRAGARWVNREEGSAARHTFDTLLATRRHPTGYDHVVHDHRAVAATVASGWAEAGICVRSVAAEAHLRFIHLQDEAYELCVAETLLDDPRIVALVTTLQSRGYRQSLADVPGCSSADTGTVRPAA